MWRLLQIEYIKLWNNRASRFLIVSYFVLLTSIAMIAAIKYDIGPVKFHLADQGIGAIAFIEILIFLVILGLGLLYAWKKGALKWE